MARIVNAFEQFFDTAGDPLVDGKLYFYVSGSTSTEKETFADVGETIPNTNPVILRADGRSPDVFGTGSYRVVLTDKDSVQILARDPVGGVGGQEFGADWNAIVTYQIGDITREGNYYYQGQSVNNEGNQPSLDAGGNWVTWPPNTQDAEIFRDEALVYRNEAEVFRDEAAVSASDASTSASNALASENAAATSAANAAISEDNAEASEVSAAISAIEAANAAAGSGKDFSATSTTSLTIGAGLQTLTIETGKGFVVAQPVVVAFDADNQMLGNVTAYNDSTGQLDVNITGVLGSGTYASWGISLQPAQNSYARLISLGAIR